MQGQTPALRTSKTQKPATASPAQEPKETEEEENPFAAEPAPTLPAGMTGRMRRSRAKLTPGLYDAGETSMGIKHLLLLKKPDAFQLGVADPMIEGAETIAARRAQHCKDAEAAAVGHRTACFANSDFAFQGNHLFREFLWREHL